MGYENSSNVTSRSAMPELDFVMFDLVTTLVMFTHYRMNSMKNCNSTQCSVLMLGN